MLCAVMLLTISAASHGHVEGLQWQAGTSEMSHSGPGWAAARERGAQPQFCTDGTRGCCAPCNTLCQTPLYSPCWCRHDAGLGGAGCPRGASEAEDPWERFGRKMRSQ